MQAIMKFTFDFVGNFLTRQSGKADINPGNSHKSSAVSQASKSNATMEKMSDTSSTANGP